jgi:hypothetical protein
MLALGCDIVVIKLSLLSLVLFVPVTVPQAPQLRLLLLLLLLLLPCQQAEMPDLLAALDGVSTASVPDGLLRDMEDVNSKGGVVHLREVSK